MTFRLRIDPLAQREIDEFAAYTIAYSEEFAAEQFSRLAYTFSDIAEAPLRRTYFVLTGPHRIEHPSFALAGARNIGSSTLSTKTSAR